MASIKLIGIDLDGTFYAPDGAPSKASLRAVAECKKAGIHVCICTGRSLAQIEDVLAFGAELDELCVLTHGASIINSRTQAYVLQRRIDPEVVDPMMRILVEDCLSVPGRYFSATGMFKTHMLKSCMRHTVLLGWDEMPVASRLVHDSLDDFIAACKPDTQLVDYSVPYSDGERVKALLRPVVDLDITTANPIKLELIPKGINKGEGLAHLAEHYGIPRQNVMAIGDGPNDESMIRWAGLGVSMGNAVESLKKIADTVVASNAQEGFAEAIRRYALGY